MGGQWSTSLVTGSLMAGSPLTVPLSPGWATMTTAAVLGRWGRMKWILWVTGEGVGECDGGNTILSVQGEGCYIVYKPM